MEAHPGEESHLYQIKVEGQFTASWLEWFKPLTLAVEGERTVLTGPLPDQAALRGLLNKMWDLNLTLISIQRLEQADKTEEVEYVA